MEPTNKSETRRSVPAGDVVNLIKELPPEERAVVFQSLEVHEQFQGPLPSPHHLRQYESIKPGAADFIFELTRKTLDHDIEFENRMLKNTNRRFACAQWMTFIITLVLIAVATFLIIKGFETVGCIVFGTTLAGVVTVFLTTLKKS